MNESSELSEAYIQYSWRLRQLHTLIRIGQGDSDEAETIRDMMDDDYSRLTPAEIDRLERLSADLNTIGEDSIPGPNSSSPEEIYRRLCEVGQIEDPQRIRDFLESNSNDPSWNALIRFRYWNSLRDPEAARPFAQFILACMDHDLADLTEHLSRDRQEIVAALPGTTETETAELRLRQDHFRRSQERLNDLISKVNLMKIHIGSFYELDMIQEAISTETNDQLLNLFSSIHSVHSFLPAA